MICKLYNHLWSEVEDFENSLHPNITAPALQFLNKPKMYPFISWLVVLGFNGPLRQYFSLYRAVSQREGEKGEKG